MSIRSNGELSCLETIIPLKVYRAPEDVQAQMRDDEYAIIWFQRFTEPSEEEVIDYLTHIAKNTQEGRYENTDFEDTHRTLNELIEELSEKPDEELEILASGEKEVKEEISSQYQEFMAKSGYYVGQ